MVTIEKPIFISGCCNSGTTILYEALKEHKDLSGPDIDAQEIEELPDSMKHYLGDCTFRLWAHPDFKMCYYVTEEDYNEKDKQSILKVYERNLLPGTRFIAKSPADVFRARLMQAYFPDAHFVAVVRNGYAVSEGIIRKRKYDPDRPKFEGLYTSIEQAAEQWFRSNVTIISNAKFLHNYKIIKYEDLIENPKETLNSILDFCSLEKYSGFPNVEFRKNDNEKQIARLSDYQIETITKTTLPMLIHFDYPILNKELKW